MPRRRGSTRMPLIGPSYETKVVGQNNRKLINMFLVPDETDGKQPFSAYSTPGLKVWSSDRASDNQVRALHVNNSILYAIINGGFYRYSSTGTATLLGSLNTISGDVSISSTNTEIGIVDFNNGYMFDISSSTFSTISDPDFPNNPITITAQDGYFIVNINSSDKFYISALNDGLNWSSLDFEDAEVNSDNTVTVKSFRQELHVFGNETTEIYLNTGNVNFPFQRQPDGTIFVGCSAKRSVATSSFSIFWLGEDSNGKGLVMKKTGVELQNIANQAIAQKIQSYSKIDDALGYIYRLEGNEFYVLSFPDANATWVYNNVTGFWHEWRSSINGQIGRHRSQSYAYAYGKNIVGDIATGNLFELDVNTFTDNTEKIIRVLTTSPVHAENNLISLYNFRVDIEPGQGLSNGQGSDPTVIIEISRNGGHSFSNKLYRSAGKIGEYFRRVEVSRLGASRNFVIQLTMSDPIRWTVIGAYAELEISET